jgi:sulfate transport system permease protein
MASLTLPARGTARRPRVLPGFGLTLGFAVFYIGLLLVLPLAALALKASALTLPEWRALVTDARLLGALRLSFGAAFAAASVNAVFGLLVAWVLVRYPFPGRRVADAMVDLPFALPTAVAGIALTTLLAPNGWVGQVLVPLGIQAVFSPLGIVIALVFIGLPFVVRTVQPVLEDLEKDIEEAAASLGASRWQTFRRVLLPALAPPLLTGFTLAFARALGEYGSVVFISGNLPYETEILPLLIMTRLEQYDYAGATAVAAVMVFA